MPLCWKLSLVTATKGFISKYGLFAWTSTFKSTDSSSSTKDEIDKNYKISCGINCTLSLSYPTSAKYATLCIRLWAACQRFLTNSPSCLTKCWLLRVPILLLMNLKNKSFSSTSPPSPLGSTCRKSTLLLMLLKESQGDLHPGQIFTNYLPTSDIASSQHEYRPSHFSCS